MEKSKFTLKYKASMALVIASTIFFIGSSSAHASGYDVDIDITVDESACINLQDLGYSPSLDNTFDDVILQGEQAVAYVDLYITDEWDCNGNTTATGSVSFTEMGFGADITTSFDCTTGITTNPLNITAGSYLCGDSVDSPDSVGMTISVGADATAGLRTNTLTFTLISNTLSTD